MINSKLVLFFATTLCALSIAAVALAERDSRHERGGKDAEVMIGDYRCGGAKDSGEISHYMTFIPSGDIFTEMASLYGSFDISVDPGEACGVLSHAHLEVLGSRVCTAGPIQSTSDESGESRSFNFVCHSRRSGIVALIADASALFYTVSP